MTDKSKIIWGAVAFALFCGIAGCVTRKAPEKSAERRREETQHVSNTSPRTETIEITKEWSTTIPIYDGGLRKNFSYWVPRDDVAYEVEYNDGESKGGWIDPLPARNDRDSDWVAPVHEGKLLNARFRISKDSRVKKAWLTYTIALKPEG
ncbi:MAG: hypothetical protein V4697_02940 [Patescibacteria group bacterium]